MAETMTGVPAPPPPAADSVDLERRVDSGARWFWWIAGLSAVNSIAWWAESSWAFVVGLGITQVFDGLGSAIGSWAIYLAIVLDIAVVCGFGLLGWLAAKHQAAMIVGIVLYALDGLLLLWATDYMSVGFHAFALFFIVNGYLAMRRLAAEQALAANRPPAAPAPLGAPPLPAFSAPAAVPLVAPASAPVTLAGSAAPPLGAPLPASAVFVDMSRAADPERG